MSIDTTAEDQSDDFTNPSGLGGFGSKFRSKAGKVEARFLSLLRFAALLIAALVLILSAIMLAKGFFQQIGKTEVDAAPVTVASEDVTPIRETARATVSEQPTAKLGISQNIRQRTLQIFKAGLKPYQRPDTKITEQEVVDFIWSEERIASFNELAGRLVGTEQKVLDSREDVMRHALGVVEAANRTANFKKQLVAYRDAKKVNVCTEQTLTRSRSVSGWDASAEYCEGWYDSPVGCPSTRVVEEPYMDTVCEMKFPENLEDPAQQFASAIQRYVDMAEQKLESASDDARDQTAANLLRKEEGISSIFDSGKLFLGFLAVMFLYLFVAIERHYRRLGELLKK